MTINVSINGNKLFDWTGDAKEVGRIDKWVRKVARKEGVTPDLVAQAALFGALKKDRPQTFTRGDAILVWKLLSGPTCRPDLPGPARDYIEAWDFDFDIRGTWGESFTISVDTRMQGEGQWKSLN